MALNNWLAGLAPDIAATFRRFPLPIVFTAIVAVVALGAINEVDWLQEEVLGRTALGLASGAAFGVGGVLFTESRPDRKNTGLLLTYVVPLLVAASAQITATEFYFPLLLPAIGVLWVSVSAFTHIGKGAEREDMQNRFWWLNQHAIVTATLAVAAFALIFLGIVAIERTLATLFGLDAGGIFYSWVLPFTGIFLVPVYWLSTLPLLSQYDERKLHDPDFLSRAIGFLGQFILAPLLIVYGLILLAYAGRIIITQTLPQGMLGWMVLGFVITGAATWLLLHPPFMRERLLVRIFRRWWFWLTLIPLALFFYAVFVRADAYGLTTDRILLLAGGVWAAVLAVAFLARRFDIRLIPALAGAILIVLSVGPWNAVNLPAWDQATRQAAAPVTPTP